MSSQSQTPLIIAFVSDLMFAIKIENVIKHLGFRLTQIGNASQFGQSDPSIVHKPGESLAGQRGRLIELLVTEQPALLIFDLGNEHIPWQTWIGVIKSAAATRRLPILAYAPHVDEVSQQQAKLAGADMVVPRSRFANKMPALIQSQAYLPDYASISQNCAAPLADLAREGIALMNAGNYFDAHEYLEDAWKAEQSPGRDLYRAILQMAVAYFQIERKNINGALKLLLRVNQWLQPLPDQCRTVDVARLREDRDNVYHSLRQLEPNQLDQFDWALCRPVLYSGYRK